jgi:hypothetical protein
MERRNGVGSCPTGGPHFHVSSARQIYREPATGLAIVARWISFFRSSWSKRDYGSPGTVAYCGAPSQIS